MPNKLLICEGACNPSLKDLDALIEEMALGTGSPKAPTHFSVDVFKGQVRRLRLTPHIEVSDQVFACVECGKERKF